LAAGSRRYFAVGVISTIAAATPVVAAALQPLSFVVILVDDLGWTDLSCQGSTYYETPHIDRLAATGMRFTNGYAACAVCSPTRAAMMTGRYPGRIGVTDWIRAKFQRGRATDDLKDRPEYEGGPKHSVLCPTNPFWMDREEITLAEALGPAGYTSCHIGKWHLGVDGYYPEQQGFAFNYGGCDLGQPPSYFDPYENRRYDLPTLAPRKQGEYLTDREADEAVGFLRAHRDQPFFLYLAHYAVHTPIQAKKSVTAKYDAKPKTNHKNATYALRHRHARTVQPGERLP
jgi:arylsulfatase A-like enzyme